MTRPGFLAAALMIAPLAGCQGAQSAFDPAGVEAERVLNLFWIMLAGGTAIWIVVIGVSYYAARGKSGPYSDKSGIRLIVWGGCVFPAVVLAGLLWWGLTMMPELRRAADGPTIAVSAERFWWRVAYAVEGEPGVIRKLPRGGVPSANEIWIPLGKRTEILLSSPDVIHSFWVPPLAGKMDAIPGRVNRLILEPTETGIFNGTCAEFCGLAHAQMGFPWGQKNVSRSLQTAFDLCCQLFVRTNAKECCSWMQGNFYFSLNDAFVEVIPCAHQP